MAGEPSRYLTFRAAGRLQALPAEAVREIVKLPRMTRVPHAPRGVAGVANVRGAALPILSVAALQGKASANDGRVLVLDRADPIGLLVDAVHAIVDAKGRARTMDIEALVGLAFRQAPARVASAKARSIASPRKANDRATLDLISFVVGQQEFALPLDQVIEVIVMPTAITRLPDADRAVIGTVAHRGDLLPILALAPLLGLVDRGSDMPSRVIVAMLRGHHVGLAVDAMRPLLQVDEDGIDPVPTVIARRASEARIQAIARLEEGRRLVSILATDKLFDEAVVAHIVARHDNRAEEEAEMAADATEPFLIFRLGTQSFGLPAMAVEEITRLPDTLTRLPRAPGFVEGVMNLRGRAIPVIDQRKRFGEEAPVDRRRRAIVIRMGALQAAFVVDEVAEIRRLPVTMLAPAPDISDETRLFDRTATMADGSIILLIEPAELLDGTERDLLTALQTDATSA
jgi:purine-binding chemotaxis protein CheW